MREESTIYAPATAPGRSGLAVVRLSGPDAGHALRLLTGREAPPPRKIVRRSINDPITGESLDQGMVAWFPAPGSFTGEAVAELYLHGGRAVLAAVLAALAKLPNLKLAEPGEFTRRAFLNGRLDLTEVEGLADLVAAETEAQRRQAIRQLEGALGALYGGWSESLTAALARLEAAIDFPDEDLPADLIVSVAEQVAPVASAIAQHLADGHRGERLREGLSVAILGPPNAGKSSLFNALSQREAAIVSPHEGTTRDVLEVALDLRGYPVLLADTAGLRRTRNEIEAEGVRRAERRAEGADLRVFVLDAERAWEQLPSLLNLKKDRDLVLVNKIDLLAGRPLPDLGLPFLPVSVRSGTGLNDLVERIAEIAAQTMDSLGSPALTRARHRAALEEAAAALGRSVTARDPELLAEDLRLAVRALGRITGRVDVEDLLERIFLEFCIGK
ncbi:MAG TPA: tRNA uridine-5-carboxymethylaminomethyl(34) synthesis GTPase MnmE [Hypericibacter adhaerens]|uniref:tRNA modification GTPase MnmE n=1 Tax=Hypericibacter adhaerens TaxID=2602016 RepID=A0A5J6N5C9_9PROT|nr:tRNA uridine-5-carboxymethylaminomethyl(34) synthesis GTPase MnmE [Hypericibacter adhaerens]QEX25111.1 tRNA modification GTPase MnmE [Hypericibacter adhaerens]HWA45712.1 tRNA uridine-5-carboxymethylaminomethyl(34) synthesis GTPase MnmE [Hypericibacter adhaerens]